MRSTLIVALAFSVAVNVAAQDPCPTGRRVPDFGYGFVSCDSCLSTVIRNGEPMLRFSGELALHQIRANGPAAGKLSEGDTLVSVDGASVRTEAGAIKLAEWSPGARRLTVRRNGATRTVAITPVAVCTERAGSSSFQDAALRAKQRELAEMRYRAGAITRADYERAIGNDELADSLERDMATARFKAGMITRDQFERAMGRLQLADSLKAVNALMRFRAGVIGFNDLVRVVGAARADSVARAGSVGRPPPASPYERIERFGTRGPDGAIRITTSATPPALQASLGFALACGAGCQIETRNGVQLWHFTENPLVTNVVTGGVADRLGLRPGVSLVTIDGIPVTTAEGAQRLATLSLAKSATLGWLADGAMHFASTGTGQPARQKSGVTEVYKVGNVDVEIVGRGARLETAIDLRTRTARSMTITIDSVQVIISIPPP